MSKHEPPNATQDLEDESPPARVVYFTFRQRPGTHIAIIVLCLIPAGLLVRATWYAVQLRPKSDRSIALAMAICVPLVLLLERRLRRESPRPRPGVWWETVAVGLMMASIHCVCFAVLISAIAWLHFRSFPPTPSGWFDPLYLTGFAVVALLVLAAVLSCLRRPCLRRVRLARALCVRCSYPLKGLAGDRCPECGTAVPRPTPPGET